MYVLYNKYMIYAHTCMSHACDLLILNMHVIVMLMSCHVHVTCIIHSCTMSQFQACYMKHACTVWRETLVVGKFGELSAKLPLAK